MTKSKIWDFLSAMACALPLVLLILAVFRSGEMPVLTAVPVSSANPIAWACCNLYYALEGAEVAYTLPAGLAYIVQALTCLIVVKFTEIVYSLLTLIPRLMSRMLKGESVV